MCNPRRIRVQATRRIAEAWQAEIEQAATAHGDVTSEARLVQSIGDLLPPRARTAFEQAMRSAPDWEQADGEYRRTVPGGHISYRPETGELEIVIRLSVAIEEVATATLVESGEVTDEVTANASSVYYGNSNAKYARQRAQETADAQVEEMAARRTAALKHQAEEAARHALNERTGEAAEQARRTAEERLTTRAEEMRPDLDQQAGDRLQAVREETLKGIFQLVAAGYSAALQAYAAENGENLQVSEEDGVISIQFEVEA